jgi:hypothetical protein
VALRFAGDLEYADVADALGTTPQAARVRQRIIGAGLLGEYAPAPSVG